MLFEVGPKVRSDTAGGAPGHIMEKGYATMVSLILTERIDLFAIYAGGGVREDGHKEWEGGEE